MKDNDTERGGYNIDSWQIDIKNAIKSPKTYAVKIEGYTDDGKTMAGEITSVGELQMEIGRSWWQFIIPISKVYVVKNVDVILPSNGNGVLQIMGGVDGDCDGPKMKWVWRKPKWVQALLGLIARGGNNKI